MTLQQIFDAALRHHQAGQLPEAESLYRQILAQQPDHADALHLLGLIAHQVGRADIAADLIGRAITLKPDFPAALNDIGIVLKGKGRIDEAIAAFCRAIALRPNYAEANSNLGVALKDKGELDGAIVAYRRALALGPDSAETWDNLGNALSAKRELDEAIASYRQAIAIRPEFVEAYLNLGNALSAKDQRDEAIAAYRQTIALRPSYPEAYLNLGIALWDKGQPDEAIAANRQAIALRPNYPEAYLNLGAVQKDRGELDEAIAAYRQAIALRPDYAEARSNLGVALLDQGQLDEAIAAYRLALKHKPDFAEAHSNLVMSLHYHPDVDARTIAEEHRRWNRQHAEPVLGSSNRPHPHANTPDPDRRLRIGYVSPDFKQHAVAPMVLPLLANHDRRSFEVFCYAQVKRPDAVTERFRSAADQWRSTVGLSHERMADQIREDQIDILVDLAGHTTGGRMLVFARKPAPVQVTRQGYPNTTGLTAIDYRMTDALADPPGLSDMLHSEQLVRLPQTNWIYQAPENGPAPGHRAAGGPFDVAQDGPITFGCFNNFTKVTEPMLALWGQILRSVPESRLLLKARSLGNPGTRQRVLELFIREGIDAARVELRGVEPKHRGHLALYNRVDIALDPFPYHGTTTTCEAMWMGTPVITLAGQTHVSRVGVSLLTNIGLAELIAESPDAYVRIAVELAGDLPRLRDLHSTLRQRMENSPVMDAPSFARNIEAAYRKMWQTWCDTAGGPNSKSEIRNPK